MIYWLLFIALEIGRNWYMIEKAKSKPIYFQSFILRVWAHIIICIFVYNTQDVHDWIPVLLLHVTSFWLIFDPVLNLLRGKKWYYRGATSGWLDRLPSKLIYWLLKIAALTYLIQWFIS